MCGNSVRSTFDPPIINGIIKFSHIATPYPSFDRKFELVYSNWVYCIHSKNVQMKIKLKF